MLSCVSDGQAVELHVVHEQHERHEATRPRVPGVQDESTRAAMTAEVEPFWALFTCGRVRSQDCIRSTHREPTTSPSPATKLCPNV
ncbi:hypothetical protein ASG92_09930 [Arthrobacter sp. Soil736]|nr:hypothetical protein ASG92_09930 [Arthrobacter sp. Soil736]